MSNCRLFEKPVAQNSVRKAFKKRSKSVQKAFEKRSKSVRKAFKKPTRLFKIRHGDFKPSCFRVTNARNFREKERLPARSVASCRVSVHFHS
jgi:hypothetical protein